MAAISETTFSNAKCMNFPEFHCFSLKFELTILQHLFQIMVWRRPGDKPLSEPVTANLLMHIYAPLGLNELDISQTHVVL